MAIPCTEDDSRLRRGLCRIISSLNRAFEIGYYVSRGMRDATVQSIDLKCYERPEK